MSTGKTEFLGLHVWEPTDDFLREEFNENNEKVDAAVKAGGYETLLDVTTAAQGQVSLDVSEFDLTQFWRLELYLQAVYYGPIPLRVNGLSSGYTMAGVNSTGGTGQSQLLTIQEPKAYPLFFCIFAPAAGGKVQALKAQVCTTSIALEGGTATVNWEDLHSVDFAASLPAGTRIVLKGVKR